MSILDTVKAQHYHTHEGWKTRYEFPFKTKEEYLQWRDEWRSEYAELSTEIRDLRLERKEAALDVWRHADIQGKKAWKRVVARRMMETRMAAKEHSIRLKKLAQKQAA